MSNCVHSFLKHFWKVSKYGVISGLYFPVFNPNTGKYRPEITPYLDTFHAVYAASIAFTCERVSKRSATFITVITQIRTFSSNLGTSNKNFETTK